MLQRLVPGRGVGSILGWGTRTVQAARPKKREKPEGWGLDSLSAGLSPPPPATPPWPQSPGVSSGAGSGALSSALRASRWETECPSLRLALSFQAAPWSRLEVGGGTAFCPSCVGVEGAPSPQEGLQSEPAEPQPQRPLVSLCVALPLTLSCSLNRNCASEKRPSCQTSLRFFQWVLCFLLTVTNVTAFSP